MNSGDEPTITMSSAAFRLLASRNLLEANKLLLELFSTGSPKNRSLGVQYLSALGNNMLSYLYCDSEEMANALKYTNDEWRFAQQLKINKNQINMEELTIDGKIDLQNTTGPISIPFCKIGSLDLSNSSNIDFPLLKVVYGDYLTISHSSGLKFPILETFDGTIWAPGAMNVDFEKIELILGNLVLTKAINLCFDNLKRIDGNVNASKANGVNFQKLVRILGRLDVRNAENIKAPMLNQVGSIAKSMRSDLYAPLLPKRPMNIPYLPT